MNNDILCSACEKDIEAPAANVGNWLVCPHCGGRTPNPLAFDLRTTDNNAVTSLVGIIGTLFLVFGFLAVTVGSIGMALVDEMGWRTGVVFGGFFVAFVTGFVLLRVDYNARRNMTVIAGRTLLVMLGAVLVAGGGFVVAFVTCIGTVK